MLVSTFEASPLFPPKENAKPEFCSVLLLASSPNEKENPELSELAFACELLKENVKPPLLLLDSVCALPDELKNEKSGMFTSVADGPGRPPNS